jgi:hypothetical protein
LAKALKFAALAVGAVALIATGVGAVALGGLAGSLTVAGVSTGTLFLASGGLTLAASLLQKGPKVTASQTDRLTASIDPRTFRKTVLGQTAMPVDVRYEEWSGKDQEICDWIVAFASHGIDGLEEIWFDTEMAWSATTGVVAKYNGYFSIPNLVLEGTPQNAFTFGQWNRNSARLTGCAYARFRFKVTGNSKKAESPFSSGIPSRITVIGRGAKLYDPRRDSTVPGGSGPMRADDQSTWRFKTDDGVVIGENLPLQILRVILGWRIRNPASGVMKLATGAGVPMRRISLPSFQVAANLADELVNRAAGGNEPRYHGAGVISEGDDQKTVLDMLCSACCGRFRDTGGKLALAISHNDLAAAAVDDGLNDDDVVGAFTWDPDPSFETTPNVVRGRYVDASSASLYQLIDYPEVRLPSPDGQDRFLSLDLGVVESPSHAQRVAKQVLQRRQYARQFAAPFDIRAWKYTVGDVLPFTFAPLGFKRGLFRVKEQELGQGGTCNMVLTFETPAFYQWDADDSLPVQGAEPIVYDRGNNPLILAIDEAATTAFWNGVTGDGKPADDATNSADPNSPFGPGTVGGAINQISEFDRQIAAAKEQLGYINDTTIPTITAAVADANTRIDAARQAASDADEVAKIAIAKARSDIDKAVSDLAAEVLRAQGEDEDLSQRIDAISASAGYDDTSIRALIQTVDTARADDKRAIAGRLDSVITIYDGQFTNTNSRVTQNFTTLSNADTALGSRIDSVISEYRGLDTATNARVTTNIATLADADKALGQRIDALVADGGYDDTSVRSAITTNNTASINRDTAIGQRIDSLITSYQNADTAANSRIDTVSITATTARDAVASLTTSVDTRFNGVNNTLSSFDQSIAALSTAQTGFASRATKLEAAASAGGSFLNANPNFAIWPDGQRLPNGARDWNGPTNLVVERFANTERADSPYFINTNQTAPNINIGILWDVPALVDAGWYAMIVEATLSGGTWEGAGLSVMGGYNLDFCGTADSAGDISATKMGNRRWSIIFQKPADTSRNFHAMQSWNGFGRNRTQKIIAWRFVGIRAATDLEVKAGKADAALPLLTARVTTAETTLTDLPNLYAAAARATDLEAKVNGTAGSNLLARASDQATVIADAKVGALAQTVSTLRADQEGTYGLVVQQAGVLAGVNGRTSVYWQVTGTTPDGSATVQLSKADGTPGLFYIGANLLVDGNAIFNGTVTIKALDRSTMTATSSGSVSGSYGGAGQAAFAYIPNLGADMAIRSGGSIYLTFTGNIAATTDTSGSIYASFEILNAADGSLLASVRLPTPGFGPGGRLDNFVIRILNVWGEVTIRWRVANRATGSTWSIVQNPQCSVYWTAL